MKIGLDLRILQTGNIQRGIGFYTDSLLHNLIKTGSPQDQWLAFFDPHLPFKKEIRDKLPSILRWEPLLLWRRWGKLNFIEEKARLSFNLQKYKLDLFHVFGFQVPGSYLPLWNTCPLIVTVHDLIPFIFPEEQAQGKLVHLVRRFDVWLLRRATRIIAISQATEKDLQTQLQIPADKIQVIYGGIGQDVPTQLKEEKTEQVLNKWGLKKGSYLLFVGDIEGRKNIKRMLEAFHKVHADKPNLRLVLVGHNFINLKISQAREINKLMQRLSLNKAVIKTGFVDAKTLTALYQAAAGLLFATLYEGFGLPVLEAYACGCPVVVSRTSSLPEVAGKAAVYVDPYQVDKIAEGVRELLSWDQTERQRHIELGFKQKAKFSWPKAARQTYRLYQSLIPSQPLRLTLGLA